MANCILAVGEVREGQLKKITWEVVSQAKRLGAALNQPVCALLIGSGVNDARKPGEYGAATVFVADDAKFARYSTDGYADVVAKVARECGACAVLLGATAMGKDLAPAVAVTLETGVAADVTALAVAGGEIAALRPVYAGKARVTVTVATAPFMATLRPNVFLPEAPNAGAPVEVVKVDVSGITPKAPVTLFAAAAGGKVDLAEASIVVSGGRGVKGKAEGDDQALHGQFQENYKLLENLAATLGAATGASRAVVDAGWKPHSFQVGQTGKTVSPNVYIACGISGAIQHLAGMSSSKVIVAVNKDPDAPIFQVANYGIVGDLFEVLPKLNEEFKKALG
ncbi:MAG: electron transfer flavoprotein subunit alpha/FixB family protein [Planctomycetes bacterium]|nr:electron transfer flavoprotein subunit alpha/FixB family protein [Planctomycetota bacterium]